MDKAVFDHLKQAGVDVELKDRGVTLPIAMSEGGEVFPLEKSVFVISDEVELPEVRLKKVSELFTGTRQPPDFKREPPEEYIQFFGHIEKTAFDYCSVTNRVETDVELERIYNLLRRRPDGKDFNPLFSYLQGMFRLYMSLRDVSQAEFEAVAARLARSAKTFSEGPSSKNYYHYALKQFE